MPKLITSLFAITFYVFAYSQADTLIDFPVKQLTDDYYSNRLNLGKDSINEVFIHAQIFTVDRSNLRVPVEYTVFMIQYFPVKYHLFAIMRCGDSACHQMSYRVPGHCQYWAEPDSNTLYYVPKSLADIENSKYEKLEEYRPDSVAYTDKQCISEFYRFENDSIRCDTLFEIPKTRFDLSKSNGIPYWQCSYYLELKHGKETAYYHLNEITGECMNGNTNLKKYEGKWKFGKKEGKWYFYDKYGDLVRTEMYRNGVCKKINYHPK